MVLIILNLHNQIFQNHSKGKLNLKVNIQLNLNEAHAN